MLICHGNHYAYPAIKAWVTLSSEIDSHETITRSGDFQRKCIPFKWTVLENSLQ